MQKITTAATITIVSGQVKLAGAQAATRMHALRVVKADEKGGGLYDVTAPIQFKKGETFYYDGEVRKDGVLADPEVEQLARMEADQAAEARVRAELEPKLRAEFVEQLLASLKPETAASVRAELAAADKSKA